MLKIFLLYFVIINIIGFILIYVDKRKAINHKWRISEATLIGISILGGGLGSLLSMYRYRHKTKHLKFTVGIPVIIIVQYFILSFITGI